MRFTLPNTRIRPRNGKPADRWFPCLLAALLTLPPAVFGADADRLLPSLGEIRQSLGADERYDDIDEQILRARLRESTRNYVREWNIYLYPPTHGKASVYHVSDDGTAIRVTLRGRRYDRPVSVREKVDWSDEERFLFKVFDIYRTENDLSVLNKFWGEESKLRVEFMGRTDDLIVSPVFKLKQKIAVLSDLRIHSIVRYGAFSVFYLLARFQDKPDWEVWTLTLARTDQGKFYLTTALDNDDIYRNLLLRYAAYLEDRIKHVPNAEPSQTPQQDATRTD